MKTKIIISVVALSLVLITKSAFAENETVTGTPKTVRNQVKQEVQDRRQEIKPTIAQIKEEKKTTISALKQKKAQATFNIIKTNLIKRHASLLKIKAKLEARIAKNPMKKDTTSAVAKLKEFDVVEARYIQDLATLDAKFAEINLPEIKPAQIIAGLKTAANVVQKDLNDIKNIIKEAIVLLAESPKLEVTKTE